MKNRLSLLLLIGLILFVCFFAAGCSSASGGDEVTNGNAVVDVSSSVSLRQIRVTTSEELVNALAAVMPGDEIILSEGTYTDKNYEGGTIFYAKAYGTADQPIILRSENPDKPARLCGESISSKIILYIVGDYWRIENIKCYRGSKGIVLRNSYHSVISGCEVFDTGAEGIHLLDDSSYCLVENCKVHDTGLETPGYGEAIYIGSARSTQEYGYDCHYNTVRGCTLGPNVASEHVDIKEFTIGTVVEDCTFYGIGISGENGCKSFVSVNGNDVIIRNNIGFQEHNDKIQSAFTVYTSDDVWGQNTRIEGNRVYMASDQEYLVSGDHCECILTGNVRVPDGNLFRGDEISMVITEDDVRTCGFYKRQSGVWQLYNGYSGRKMKFTFKGEYGYKVSIGAGYWDTAAINEETGEPGVWVHDETTQFGTQHFDRNDMLTIEWDVPETAVNIQLEAYYYADVESSQSYDIDRVSLRKVEF